MLLLEDEEFLKCLTEQFLGPDDPIPNIQQQASIYEYHPLGQTSDEFRLLNILPTSYNSVVEGEKIIRCQLVTSRPDRQPYACLSYTWGDATLCHKILVGGQSMEVTENLFVALEHFQHDTLTLALWVDAICIDQKDEAEKSMQVQ